MAMAQQQEAGRKRAFAGGRYGKYLLPAVIFQSVLIGGGYATGREVVQYGARFGALGLWSIVAIFVAFGVLSALAYEFARTFRVYNYRSFMRALIGPFWPLFDVLFLIMVVIVIAVMASAAGVIGQDVLGLPNVVGVGLVIVLVGVFNFLGGGFIEKAKSLGTVVLYLAYIAFSVTVLIARWGNTAEVLATGNSSYADDATVAAAVGVGILYVAYNLTVLPAVLFSLHRQTERSHTLWAGLLTGVLAIVPFILTFLCLLSFYPDESVLGAPVPWLVMLERVGGTALAFVFAAVVIFTLVETATGSTHAMADRIDDTLTELGRRPLTSTQSALFTGGVVLAGAILSSVGIIALVARGYTYMAYGFLAVFAIPLLTIAPYKIWRHSQDAAETAEPVTT